MLEATSLNEISEQQKQTIILIETLEKIVGNSHNIFIKKIGDEKIVGDGNYRQIKMLSERLFKNTLIKKITNG
jgi:hypothetical protein